jgi:hypothetical protein
LKTVARSTCQYVGSFSKIVATLTFGSVGARSKRQKSALQIAFGMSLASRPASRFAWEDANEDIFKLVFL